MQINIFCDFNHSRHADGRDQQLNVSNLKCDRRVFVHSPLEWPRVILHQSHDYSPLNQVPTVISLTINSFNTCNDIAWTHAYSNHLISTVATKNFLYTFLHKVENQ